MKNNKLINFITNNLSMNLFFKIFILGLADVFTMAAPYYLKYIIPNIHSYLGIDQPDFDRLNAILGYVVLATQIPGGWLTNKFSSRKMLSMSLFLTGFLSVWWTLIIQIPFNKSEAMNQLYIIYVGWGISTTLIFWAPLWKLLSQLGKKEDQGKVFGLQGTLNGIAGLFFITFLGSLATYLTKQKFEWAFYVFSYILSGILVTTGFLVWIFMKDVKPIEENNQEQIKQEEINKLEKNSKDKEEKNINNKIKRTGIYTNKKLKETLTVSLRPMKSIRVWLLAFFVMGMYMFQSVFAYYMKDTLSTIGLSAVLLTVLAGVRAYGMRMFVSSPFGKWADKRKSYILVLIWILVIGLMFAIAFTVLPGYNSYQNWSKPIQTLVSVFMIIIFLIVGILSWFLVAIRYVQVVEIPYDKGSYGTVIGLISFIAFSPDAWFYQMASEWGKNNKDDNGSYTLEFLQTLLLVALGVVLFGLVCGTIAFLINKKEIKAKGITDYRWRKLNNA